MNFFIRWNASLILATLWLTACSKRVEPPKQAVDTAVPITVAKVELVPMDQTLSLVGTLYAKDAATISAEVEGRVEKTMAEFGDRLKAGQEIASIDTTTYEALARQSAANLSRAKANAVNAVESLKRIQSLHQNKISSDSDLDKAVADEGQAQADIKAAEAADAVAQLNLKHSHVVTPFDSAVADRIATVGDYMKAGTPMFRVVNDNVLKYIVQAPEAYAHQIQKEQLITLTVDDWPTNTFEGRVYLISPEVNVTTRAFALGALVENAGHKLKSSSFARGDLVLQKDVPTPMVPIGAVVNFAGVTRVFVIESDVARSREIKVGRIKDGRQEILSGLQPGESVALTGLTKLQEGSKVRLKAAEVQKP